MWASLRCEPDLIAQHQQLTSLMLSGLNRSESLQFPNLVERGGCIFMLDLHIYIWFNLCFISLLRLDSSQFANSKTVTAGREQQREREHLRIQLAAFSHRTEKKSTVLTVYLITQQRDSPSSLPALQLPTQLFSSRLPSLTMHGLASPSSAPPLFFSPFIGSWSILTKPLTHTCKSAHTCLHCTRVHLSVSICLRCKCDTVKARPHQQKVLKPISVMSSLGTSTREAVRLPVIV